MATAVVALAAAALACSAARLNAGARAAPAHAEPPDLRIADADFGPEPRKVSSAEALEDFEIALYAYGEAYAGTYGAAGEPSEDAIASTRDLLASRSEWPPADLAYVLLDVFRRPDGHLAFGYGGRAPLRLFAVTPRSSAGAPRADGAPDLELNDGPVPVLAIRSFDNADEVAMRSLPDLARRLRRSPQFIVDLRGNPGGNYLFAERFVLELTDRELQRLDEREVVSIAAAEGRANSVRRRLAEGGVPPGALPHFRAQLAALEHLAAELRAEGAQRNDVVRVGETVRGRASGPLRSRAVFLVDGGCASACEMMVALARQIPGVIVVGQNTRGGMAFGELALFRLPHSGVELSLGTRAFADPFGDFVETRGFEPDVWFDAITALDEAKHVALASWVPDRSERQRRLVGSVHRLSHAR